MQIEGAKQSYYREKRREENISDVNAPKEEYIAPTTTAEKAKEVLKYKGYAGTVLNGYFIPTIGTLAEKLGIATKSPTLRKWGENFADETAYRYSQSAEAQSVQNVPGALQGGLLDPRYYAKNISQTIGFMGAVFGSSVLVTAVTKNPVAGLATGFAVNAGLESANAYQSMLDEGINPEDAAYASQIYGVISATIENATGLAPAEGVKILSKDFAKEIVKTAGWKQFLKTWVEEGIIEEGSQQFVQNVITKVLNRDTKLTQDVVESMVGGMVGAFPLVGGISLYNKVIEGKKEKEVVPKVGETTAQVRPEVVTKPTEEVITPVEEVTPKPTPESVSGARDILRNGKGNVNLSADLVSKLQAEVNEYQDKMAFPMVEILNEENKRLANIEVIQYPDGRYSTKIEAETPNYGILSDFLEGGLFNTRKEAVAEAKEKLISFATQNLQNTTAGQEDVGILKDIMEQAGKIEPESEKPITIKKERKPVIQEKIAEKIKKEESQKTIIPGFGEIDYEKAKFTPEPEKKEEKVVEEIIKPRVEEAAKKQTFNIDDRVEFPRKGEMFKGKIMSGNDKNGYLVIQDFTGRLEFNVNVNNLKKIEEYEQQPINQPAGTGTNRGELSATLQVGEGEPSNIGGTTEERGGEVARGKYPVSGEGVRYRPSPPLETNEQIAEFVKKYTFIGSEKQVFENFDYILSDQIGIADFRKAAKNYQPAGGREKQGAEGKGLLDEYYTPSIVVNLMRDIVNKYLQEDKGYKILEPSAGTGRFLNDISKGTPYGERALITAYEINPISAGILKGANPTKTIYNLPFESIFIDDRGNKKEFIPKYDLVIGNPPYGEHRGKFKGLGEEPTIHKYEEYFIKRSLDLTVDGGIVAMVVPSRFLREGANNAKVRIGGLAKLVDAYRLPNKIFGTTDIGTDIVVFQKIGKKGGGGVQDISNDLYFNDHPQNIIGVEKERKGRFGMEKYVEGGEEEIKARLKPVIETKPESPTVTPEEETAVNKIVETNSSQETSETKQEIINEIKEEVENGEIKNIKAYIKNWNKNINETEEKPAIKPKGGKKVAPVIPKIAGKEIIQPIKKKAGLMKVQDLAILPYANDPVQMAVHLNTEPTGEIKGETLQTLSEEDIERVANYSDGLMYNDFNYYSGNVYDKLDQLEKDKAIVSKKLYDKQKKRLTDILPQRQTVERISIAPNTPFAEMVSIYDKESDKMISLKEAFIDFVQGLPRSAFGESSPWEIVGYISQRPVRGEDKVRNNLVRARRREMGNKLFGLFLRENLDPNQQKIVEDAYNHQFNGYVKPDYKNVPLSVETYNSFNGQPLEIKEVQLQGIGFLVNKGLGVLAHDVGVGKTMQAIISMGEMLKRGWAQRPLVITPSGNVYRQWIHEIQELIPDIKINDLSNLGGDFKGDLASLTIEPGTLSIMTYDGFKRLGFKDETYDDLTMDLQDTIENPNEEKTKRAKELQKARTEETIGLGMKGTKTEKYFEDLGFDLLTMDEVHNANHIIKGAKLTGDKVSEFRGLTIRPSSLGIKTWLATQYILKKNNNRNVFLLSATPFTNNPMEYYSVLSLVARQQLQRMGLKNVNEFMNTFMDLTFEFEVTADGKYQEKNTIRGFKNYQQFWKLLTEFIDFRDGEEAGVARPNRVSNEIVLHATQKQLDYLNQAQELFTPKYTDQGGKLQGIGEMRRITFSPYLSRYYEGAIPDYKTFVEGSPKIKATMEAISQNKKDNPEANQVIYSPIGVEYFPFIKEYLVKELGYDSKTVGVITGAVKGDERVKIQEKFNSGEIKVIIGSDAIQEGVNLQKRTTDLFILALPWNFTELKQVIGRVWRQGNMWKNVRIHNPFIENSVDVFQSQKLENKQKRYEASLKFKGDYLDVGDINFDEIKLDLISDPVMRVEVELAVAKSTVNKNLNEAKADYAYFLRKFTKLTEAEGIVEMQKDFLQTAEERLKGEPDNDYYKKLVSGERTTLAQNERDLQKIRIDLKQKGLIDFNEVAKKEEKITQFENELKALNDKYKTKLEEAKKVRVEQIVKPNDYTLIKTKLAQDASSFFEKVKPVATKVKPQGGANLASMGTYLEGEEILLGEIEKIRPLEMPEMIEIATEFMKATPTVGKMQKALGRFRGKGTKMGIKVSVDLFKPENITQLARTMAHEIGHLVDYVPDLSLSHGVLKNRIVLITEHLSESFGANIKNTEFREELKKASAMWRPWDPETVSKSFKDYRNSGKELYADAISMLLNNPGLLEKTAPKFYKAFFESLDQKPEVNEKYWELQDRLSGAKEELYLARQSRIQKGFQRASDIQKGFEEKARKGEGNLGIRLRQQLDDRYYQINRKVQEAEARGEIIDDNDNPKYLLNELAWIDNENYLMVEKFDKEISQPIKEAGMTDEDIGMYLLLDRIQTGRKEVANPYGFLPSNASEQLEYLKKRVGADNFKLLQDKTKLFHEEVFKVVEEAVRVGSYNKQVFEEKIAPNKYNYASFGVVDYLQEYVSPGVKKMIGTFKEVANPYHYTILKTAALVKLNAMQRAKNATRDYLLQHYKGEIKKSESFWGGKFRIFKGNENEQLRLLEDGRPASYDVDPYIARSFNYNHPEILEAAMSLLGRINQVFKSIVTTYNLGFSLYSNPIRDFRRNYKILGATHSTTALQLLTAYFKSLPSAVRYASGTLDEFTRKLVEDKAIQAPIFDYNFDPRDDEMGRILQKYGVIKLDTPETGVPRAMRKARRFLLKPVTKTLAGMRFVANTFEIVSKIAGARIRMGAGETGKELTYNIRNFTGTPNWKNKGTSTYITNEVFVFSNITKEGIKSEYLIAVDPKTRSGYLWRSVMVDLLPKFLMFLAAVGLFGDKLKDLFAKMTEYDKTNYLTIPLGENNDGKATYVRIPHDETGRLTSAIFWKMLNFSKDQNINGLQDVVALAGGQLPSITPVLTILSGWGQYLMGKNPYDAFRGRLLLPETLFTAGGLPALKKMVEWTANTFGITSFATYDPAKNTTLETTVQILPLLNRIIKMSDYGVTEEVGKIGKEEARRRAKEMIGEKELINKIVEENKNNPDFDLALSALEGMTKLLGHEAETEEELSREKSFKGRLKTAMIAGKYDSRFESLLYAGSNKEKILMIKKFKADMGDDQFAEFVDTLLDEGIISKNVYWEVAE